MQNLQQTVKKSSKLMAYYSCTHLSAKPQNLLWFPSSHVEHFMRLRFILFDVFQTLMEGNGDKAAAEGMELLRKSGEKLKEELKTSEDGGYPSM